MTTNKNSAHHHYANKIFLVLMDRNPVSSSLGCTAWNVLIVCLSASFA